MLAVQPGMLQATVWNPHSQCAGHARCCYSMGYVVENAGRRKLVRPRLHGRDGVRCHSMYSSEAACGSLRIQNYRVWVPSSQLSDQWPPWPSGGECVCMRVLGTGRCAQVSCGRENTGLEGKMHKDLQGEKYSLLY